MLSNFARHDIKNSVQSMDSILSAYSLEELNKEHVESLKLNLQIIRETIENFSELVPYSQNDNFTLTQLLTAVELLNRESFYINKIEFIKEVPDVTFTFNQPFQSVLQMINNIIINAIKAFEDQSNKKIKVAIDYNSTDLNIKIYDNASIIAFENIDTIFENGKSSTGGSGIGLFHAIYLCDLYKGKINVYEIKDNVDFNKFFSINSPIINIQ